MQSIISFVFYFNHAISTDNSFLRIIGIELLLIGLMFYWTSLQYHTLLLFSFDLFEMKCRYLYL